MVEAGLRAKSEQEASIRASTYSQLSGSKTRLFISPSVREKSSSQRGKHNCCRKFESRHGAAVFCSDAVTPCVGRNIKTYGKKGFFSGLV